MADQEKKTEDKEQKQEKQEKQETRIEDEEDLLKLLQQLYKDSDKKVKVKIVNKMGISIKIFENILLDFLVMTIINMGLLLGICGWFKVIEVKHFYELLIITFSFSLVDYWLKTLIFKLKPDWYVKTMGLLFTIVSMLLLIGIGFGAHYLFDATFNKAIVIVGSIVVFLIVRTIIVTYLKKLENRRKYK